MVYAWDGQQYVAGDADPTAGSGTRRVVDAAGGSRARSTPRATVGGLTSSGGGIGCQLTPARPDLRICGSGPGFLFGRAPPGSPVTGGTAAAWNGWFLVTGVRVVASDQSRLFVLRDVAAGSRGRFVFQVGNSSKSLSCGPLPSLPPA